MLFYIQRMVYILLPFIFLACGGGKSKDVLDKTPPTIKLYGKSHITLVCNEPYQELGANAVDNTDTNIKISISNNIHISLPGLYRVTYTASDAAGNTAIKQRQVEVIDTDMSNTYIAPSNLQIHKLKIDSKRMQNIPIQIKSSKSLATIDNESIRANDITLNDVNHTILLKNNSYTNIKNLIGKYVDDNNITHLVKLTFDTIIAAHTQYILKDFEYSESMQIYHTSELFDQAIRFDTTACGTTFDNTNEIKYCQPSSREQANYALLLANLHHFYNSTDALASFLAWKNKKNYHSIDLASTFQDFEEMKQSNLMHAFLKATLPNNQTTLKTSRYTEENAGVGSGETVSLLGIKENKGWLSLEKTYINFSPDTMLDDTNVYTLFHHELMHARGFSHTSGMPIGFSNALGKIMTHRYSYDTMPVFEVPKYIFDVHFEKDRQMYLTLYHTSEDYSEHLSIELLSAEALSTKLLPSEEDSHIIIKSKRMPSMRFFLRLYGEDSVQVMSQLIYPYQFTQLTTKTAMDKHHTIIPAENWQYLATHNTEHLQITPRDSEAFCKAWTGDYNSHTASLRDLKAWNNIETSLLLHSPYTDKIYYIVTHGEDREIAYNESIEEKTTAITCTTN